MDQGVIEKMKKIYRKSLLREMLLEKNEESILNYLKEINILICCIKISNAWLEITNLNICRAWRKLIPACDIFVENFGDVTIDDVMHILNRIPGYEKISQEEVSNWLQADREEPGWNFLNLEQLLQR